MSTPFIAEIKIFSFNFAPRGWARCDGQLLPINQNQALFSLLGTTYGGNGRTNFALPNLQGRVPIHFDGSYRQGSSGGEEQHTPRMMEMSSHTHAVVASENVASSADPTGAYWAVAGSAAYAASPNVAMGTGAVSNTGSSQPHENRPPFLTLNFCIALQGIFPSRN